MGFKSERELSRVGPGAHPTTRDLHPCHSRSRPVLLGEEVSSWLLSPRLPDGTGEVLVCVISVSVMFARNGILRSRRLTECGQHWISDPPKKLGKFPAGIGDSGHWDTILRRGPPVEAAPRRPVPLSEHAFHRARAELCSRRVASAWFGHIRPAGRQACPEVFKILAPSSLEPHLSLHNIVTVYKRPP